MIIQRELQGQESPRETQVLWDTVTLYLNKSQLLVYMNSLVSLLFAAKDVPSTSRILTASYKAHVGRNFGSTVSFTPPLIIPISKMRKESGRG